MGKKKRKAKHTQIKQAQPLRKTLIVLGIGLSLPTSQPRSLIESVCGVGGDSWSDSGRGRRDGGGRLRSVQHRFSGPKKFPAP
jgi:hypothetical protein